LLWLDIGTARILFSNWLSFEGKPTRKKKGMLSLKNSELIDVI